MAENPGHGTVEREGGDSDDGEMQHCCEREAKRIVEAVSRAREMWHIVRWDPAGVLTEHDGEIRGRVRRGRGSSKWTLWRRGLKRLVGILARTACDAARSLIQRDDTNAEVRRDYVVLVSPGSLKYASEEREMRRAFERAGMEVLTVAISQPIALSGFAGAAPQEARLLTSFWRRVASDTIRSFIETLGSRGPAAVVTEAEWIPALLPMIRQYHLSKAIGDSLLARYGRPRALFSLCPQSSVSRALVDSMRSANVLTAGMRTQLTAAATEHLGINVDVLYCKSRGERAAYALVRPESGPILREGCVLSLPERTGLLTSTCREPFVLLLGTAPAAGQSRESYEAYNTRLFQVAEGMSLPAIFKSHGLGLKRDSEWIDRGAGGLKGIAWVTDATSNASLIERSAVVVSAPSTLLYYAVVKAKPIVIVESEYSQTVFDDFKRSPIPRVGWLQQPQECGTTLSGVSARTEETMAWFRQWYFVERDASIIARELVEETQKKEKTLHSPGERRGGECEVERVTQRGANGSGTGSRDGGSRE